MLWSRIGEVDGVTSQEEGNSLDEAGGLVEGLWSVGGNYGHVGKGRKRLFSHALLRFDLPTRLGCQWFEKRQPSEYLTGSAGAHTCAAAGARVFWSYLTRVNTGSRVAPF
jgi:hypothetical protein